MTLSISLQNAIPSTAKAPVVQPGSFSLGVNICGMEDGNKQGVVEGKDFVIPNLKELQYYASAGFSFIRLPIGWESLFATVSSTTLTQSYLTYVLKAISIANQAGIPVIVCPFWGTFGNTITPAQFATFWTLFATALVGQPGLLGYDLMNEPHSMPNTQDWISMVAAAVPAIRAVDTKSYIFVGGNDYDNFNYGTQNPGILAVTDPSNKLVYTAHVYPDNDDSGTHFDWVQQSTQASPKVTTSTGVARMNTFVNWVQTNKVVGYLGETGIANDNANWLVSADLTLAAAQKANIMASVWAGGPWWPRTYQYYLDPTSYSPLTETPQMAVCRKYTGVYPSANAAVLTGTATANSVVYLSENGVALTQVTADANGNWTATLSLANGVHVIVASTAALTADGTLAAICFNLTQ